MFNHEPQNYVCPFCKIVNGIEDEFVSTKQADIFYCDAHITAFVSSHWWPNNNGNIIIVPNVHIENIYDLPDDTSDKIHRFARRVAIALKEVYLCEGISTRQHNEHSGNQDVWHYHLHVLPRYTNDNLYTSHLEKRLTHESERIPFATKLKEYFEKVGSDN